MQDVAVIGEKQQSPASTSQRQDGPAIKPLYRPDDHFAAPPLASDAADHAQLPTASCHTERSNLSLHVAHEKPVEQEALAQHHASWHPRHVEAAAADADATVGAADQERQAPSTQSQGITASPRAQISDVDAKLLTHQRSPGAHLMARSFDLDAKPPVPKAAPQASAAAPSAYSNGHIMSSHAPQLSGQNDLAGLAAEVFRQEQRVPTSPVEQPAPEEAGVQQAVTESNGWHEEERPGDYRRQQGDVSQARLGTPCCSESQEPVLSSTAKDNSHELSACEEQSQDVRVASYVAEPNALPGQLAEPLLVGRKRQLGADDDHVLAKKQCVSLSGVV